jgi:phosphoserine phosphatase
VSHVLVFSTSEKLTSHKSSVMRGKKLETANSWLKSFWQEIEKFSPQNDACWLNAGVAAEVICKPDLDFLIREAHNSELFIALRAKASEENVDVNIVKTEARRKKLLIADMDSTIITSESLDDLAKTAGFGDSVAAITKRSIAGEIDFSEALIDRVKLLAGQPAELLDTLLDQVVITAGAVNLVKTMRAHGAKCYLVSGGFDFLLDHISNICGFDGYHGNHMIVDDNVIKGEISPPILDRGAKAKYLRHYCKSLGIDSVDTASIGDGANDLEMLAHSDMGVAYHGQKLLRDTIALQLNYSDLNGLLYLQGYSDKEFFRA